MAYYDKRYNSYKKNNNSIQQILAGVGAAALIFTGGIIIPGLLKGGAKDTKDLPEPTPVASQVLSDQAVAPAVVIPRYRTLMSAELRENLDSYLNESSSHTCDDLDARGLVLTDKLRLRKGPSTDYDIITELPDETYLQVLGVCDNDWYLVNTGHQMGFVTGEYLRVLTPEFVESQMIQPTTTFLKAVRARTGVNIRDAANSDTAEIIGGLTEGQSIAAYERLDNGWYRVQYNNREGYVSGDYVDEVYATSLEDLPLIYIRENATMSERPYENGTTSVTANQFLRIYGENEDYYLIQYNGVYGFVPKSHCERMSEFYAIVDISDQTLRIYNLGEEVFSTRVVTGKDSTPTDLGFFSIYRKERDSVMKGADYCVTVDRALYYNGGEAIHTMDRGEWDYTHDVHNNYGSHGCVNTPPDAMEKVYEYLNIGDRVFVWE